MDELDDFMLFNACEDAKEEQESSATSEYPYQKQFFQSGETHREDGMFQDDGPCDGGSRSSSAVNDSTFPESSDGGRRPRLGCLLLVIIAVGVIAYFLFGNVVNSCRENHDDACAADTDTIEEMCTIASDSVDSVTSLPKDAVSDPDHPSSSYSSDYSDDDEYDEDGMYKDEDEDIKEMRGYDDYDDDEADDWE